MAKRVFPISEQQSAFIDVMANTGNATYAAKVAEYRAPASSGIQLMNKPKIADAVSRKAQETLLNDIMPLALEVHKLLLTDPKVPAGAKVAAVKLAYDRALGEQGDTAKNPEDMSAEEINTMLDSLKRQAFEAQRVTIDAEPIADNPNAFE